MSAAPDDFKWVGKFLLRYLATVGPHDWPEDPDDFRLFAEGWVGAFRLSRVSEAEADAARVLLAAPSPELLKSAGLEQAPEFKKQHCRAVVAVALALRERAAAKAWSEAIGADPEEALEVARSRDCPECKGNGFALRKGVWADRSWHATATLYCRCSLGQYRLEKAYCGLGERESPPYDDLQAFPDLWDPALSHPTWTARRVAPPSVEGRRWRYIKNGESVPPPLSRALPFAPPPTRRPDLGRVEPAVPIPTRPRPMPAAEPVIETTDESLEWI